jgi:hypothetical protein
MIAVPRSTSRLQIAMVVLAGVLLVAGVGVAAALWWQTPDGSTNAQAATRGNAAGATAQPMQPMQPGDIGVLRGAGGLPTVILFESKDDFEAAAKASMARDEMAWKQVVRSRATFVASGSRAK